VPLYEYECTKCHHRFEKIEKFSGPHAKKCPQCGGKVEQVMAPSAIQFKGSGWYVTDYAGKSASGDSGKTEKTEGEKTEGEKAAVKDTKETKDTAAAKETKKPAKTK